MYRSAQSGVARALSNLRVRIDQTLCDSNPANFEPALEKAAEKNALVIAVGGALNNAVSAAAARHPETDFVLVDSKAGNPAVSSVLFRQNEASYLAGALSAQLIDANRAKDPRTPRVCGIILAERGAENPVMLDFLLGYEQGVRETGRNIRVLRAAVGAWNDPGRARELAAEMRRRGAQVIFQAAGASGTGVIQAAVDRFFWVIGVDEAQERVAPGIVLTSVIKHFDTAIYDIISLKYAGHLRRGSTRFYGIHDRGTGLSWSSITLVPDEMRRRLEGITYRISDGIINVRSCFAPDGTFRRDLRPLPPGGKITQSPGPPPPPPPPRRRM